MCEKRPYQSPVVQVRSGFDPEACTPEQWVAIVWAMRNTVNLAEVSGGDLIEYTRKLSLLQNAVKLVALRISADEPRTGDMIEDANGRRYWFVSAKPERLVSDPKIWNMLCQEPGMRTYLGGVPS